MCLAHRDLLIGLSHEAARRFDHTVVLASGLGLVLASILAVRGSSSAGPFWLVAASAGFAVAALSTAAALLYSQSAMDAATRLLDGQHAGASNWRQGNRWEPSVRRLSWLSLLALGLG